MELSIENIEVLLFIAAIVAMTARLLKIPYTIALVLAGIALALSPFRPEINLSKELIFTVFLPPLIYEAALYIRWSELRRDFPVILSFATLGVLLSAGVTAIGMHFIVHWGWESAALFGVLIAATDPVSVIATFKEAGVHGRLRLLVEAESLFNDSTAAVAFVIAMLFASGGKVTLFGTIQTTFFMVFGGIFCGLLVAGAMLLIAGRTDDHLVEITLTAIAAYGSFLLAEHFHASGVLASMTAGLIVGNVGWSGIISREGREHLFDAWDFFAFLANSFVFILIGMSVGAMPVGLLGFSTAAMVIVLVLVGRALAVYLLSALFARSKLSVPIRYQHVLFWGGLRGALALALALA